MENEKLTKAVCDTGPIIHLTEINLANIFNVFSKVLIPEEVATELRMNKIEVPKKLKIVLLTSEFKDRVKIFTNQENLDLGESCAISLTMQEKADYFLTDDLDARNVAGKYNIEVHGTIGIILRAFRDKLINKKIAIEKVRELHSKSSLFITNDLIDNVVMAIEEFE